MRVLVANKFLRPVGGVESHVEAVKDWLVAANHTVVPFAMAEEGNENTAYSRYFPSQLDFRASGVRATARTLERATVSSETRRKLGELLRSESIDAAYVVHVYHQLGMVMLNDLTDWGVPTVLSLHDYKIACPNYRFFSERTDKMCTKCLDHRSGYLWAPAVERCWSGSRKAGLALSLEALTTRARQSYRRPGAVVVLNTLQEKAALSAGVDASRLHRIPHPVTLGSERPNADRTHVLFVGRLVPEKGVDILIRAARTSNVPVKIVGDGRSAEALRSLAESIGAPVEFVGAVPSAEVPALLAQAAALVVPSVWHEVSPLVVYEAMAADVPVIGTNVGGMVEQLGAGRGLLVEPGDVAGLGAAMQRLVHHPDEGRALSEAARTYAAEHLAPARWSERLVAAFNAAGAEGFAV
ncbi:glycosyltransferase [Ornithinimicrobium pratense]|uniref:glycosyltransferase n=1 Tax=Ornithinimicrobium pratense TaxID=2593973 RepID=UPI0017879DBD|nr:glycosyltransferase [Ornithinimicrobium pratense]